MGPIRLLRVKYQENYWVWRLECYTKEETLQRAHEKVYYNMCTKLHFKGELIKFPDVLSAHHNSIFPLF